MWESSLRAFWRRGAPLASLYALAFLARFLFWKAPSYGDEGMFFSVAQYYWHSAPNLDDIYNDPVHPRYPFLFFHRPFFHILLTIPAHVNFDAYRFAHFTITALLPVLAVLILRDLGARRWLAYATGVIIAIHPAFVVWGTIVWPDSLMTTALAASVWAAIRGWGVRAALAGIAAVWTKETAYAALIVIFAYGVWEARRAKTATLWPLSLDRVLTGYLGALAVGLLPLLIAMGLGLGFPGGPSSTQYAGRLMDQLMLVPWLAIPLAVGLAWPRTRRMSLLGFLYPAVFLILHVVLHRGIEIWYMVAPNLFSLLGAALTIDEGWTRVAAHRNVAVRWAPRVTAAVLGLILAVGVGVSHDRTWKGYLVHPLERYSTDSFAEALEYETIHRDPELKEMMRFYAEHRPATVLVIDTQLPTLLYPMVGGADVALSWGTSITRTFHQEIGPWSNAIEERANLTLVERIAEPLNAAILEVYEPCKVFDNKRFVFLEGQRCKGSGDALEARYEEKLAAA